MPVIESLIRSEADGTISFGNYKLDTKSKLDNFEHAGDLYKIKTFYEITKLERNGSFVYESVPGTAVEHFSAKHDGVEFTVSSDKDAQITVQLEDDTEYEVYVDGAAVGGMKTNMSGKLVVSVELNEGVTCQVKVVKREASSDGKDIHIWQKQRQPYFSVRNAVSNPASGWGSARPARSGTRWWRSRWRRKRHPAVPARFHSAHWQSR